MLRLPTCCLQTKYLNKKLSRFYLFLRSRSITMKNVSSLKPSSKIDSPKTPGGISKSLLTPCRRVGLSRNWRKSGPSPFVSPLASKDEAQLEQKEDPPAKKDIRKRKQRCDEEESKIAQLPISFPKTISQDDDSNNLTPEVDQSEEIVTTPSRIVCKPQRKKSKTLTSSHSDKKYVTSPKTTENVDNIDISGKLYDATKENFGKENPGNIVSESSTPISPKSKPLEPNIVEKNNIDTNENLNSNIKCNDLKKTENKTDAKTENGKQKNPENLTKECIVVLQKKIYKKDLEKLKEKATKENIALKKSIVNPVSQALFDSDSDDVPLSTFNSKDVKCKPKLEISDEDDDFAETRKIKVKKLEDKSTSIGGLKNESSKKKSKQKTLTLPHKNKAITIEPKKIEPKPSSQSSLDDDEDFDVDRRTILIKRTYEKTTKPLKAKSTGSITQKDIDDLKAKIEMKKRLLLAKAMTEDTQELRDLVKKWQKGCQDALMELMELMKNKFPDKQNMDYSEILNTLKIPFSLVGYDEENDCFGTPTDEHIILSKFND